MSPHSQKDLFRPDEVDQQIDAYQQESSSTPEKQLLDSLRTLYATQSQSDMSEDATSVAKVQQQLKLKGAPIQQSSDAFHVPVQQTLYSRPNSYLNGAHKRRSLFASKPFQGAFALIIIGVLIGSFLTFMHTVTTQKGTVAGAGAGSNTPIQSSLFAETRDLSSLEKLNTQDGSVLWQQTLPASSKTDNIASTIIHQNGVVYQIGQTEVSAFRESNGQPLWHHTLTDQRYSINQSLVEGSRLYLYTTQATNGGVGGTYTALATSNGAQLWQNAQFGDPENTPTLQVVNNSLYTIYSKSGTPQTLYAIDGATGKVKWNRIIGGNYQVAPVTVAHGVVYTAMQNKLYAFDEQTGQVRWQQQVMTNNKSWQIMDVYPEQDTLLTDALESNGQNVFSMIYAFHIQDGTVAWSSETSRLIGLQPGQPLPIFNGTIFSVKDSNVNCKNGTNTNPTDTTNPCQSTAQLQARNISNGKIVWQKDIPCPANASECLVTDTAFANGRIVLQRQANIATADGQKISPSQTQTVKSKGKLKVITTTPTETQTLLVTVNAQTGDVELSRPLQVGDHLMGADDQFAYIVSNAAPGKPTLTAIHLTDGQQVWQKTDAAFGVFNG